jgi:hypothetical protein
LRDVGLEPVPAVYNDDFADEVLEQLKSVDMVLVWVNPIEQGRDRTRLDSILREVAAQGVYVSAHPDTVLKMGTKEVLYRTRNMSWGSEVRMYRDQDELRRGLETISSRGEIRVLKQLRGHSGQGIWKISPGSDGEHVLARHAVRGSPEQEVSLSEFIDVCADYFRNSQPMVDQEYQERLPEGMVRCYMVQDQVAGFGHQAINALHPESEPGPRLYHPASQPEFQDLKRRMELEWLPDLLQTLEMTDAELPLLWDADLLKGKGPESYVLCEINVSSVYPYPESAIDTFSRGCAQALLRGSGS